MNFDKFLTKVELLEMDGMIEDSIDVFLCQYNLFPFAMKTSVAIEDFVQHLDWVKNPEKLMPILVSYRREKSGPEGSKDFYNRRIMAFLGEYVTDINFWSCVCFQYPDYAKFYKHAPEEFNTLVKIMT